MTSALRSRCQRLCCAAALAPGLAWLILQTPAALAIGPAAASRLAPMRPAVQLAQWGYGGAPRAPQRPGGGFGSGGSGSGWPGPGMPQQGLPTMQEYNRTVDYWIRRTGPMGIDRCALSDLFNKPCQADE
jgi:hypothetical protein